MAKEPGNHCDRSSWKDQSTRPSEGTAGQRAESIIHSTGTCQLHGLQRVYISQEHEEDGDERLALAYQTKERPLEQSDLARLAKGRRDNVSSKAQGYVTGDDEDRGDASKTLDQKHNSQYPRWPKQTREGGVGATRRTSAQLLFRTRLGAGFLESAKETTVMVAEMEKHRLSQRRKSARRLLAKNEDDGEEKACSEGWMFRSSAWRSQRYLAWRASEW